MQTTVNFLDSGHVYKACIGGNMIYTVAITILCFGKGKGLFYISIKSHNVVKILEKPRRLSVQSVKIQECCSKHGNTLCPDL